MSNTTPKKPSLSFNNSPRTSPFKRADSSAGRNNQSPASTVRGVTQQPRASASPTPAPSSPALSAVWSPRPATSSTPTQTKQTSITTSQPNTRSTKNGDPLAKIPPAQLREMRESFQVLDRNNDGQVTREDVDEMLKQLGPDGSSMTDARAFFDGTGASLNLSAYLSSLATLLGPMTRSDELTAAFSAFDVDDSGQIDVKALKDSLLRTMPEGGGPRMTEAEIDAVIGDFSGRRAFKKGSMADMGKPRGEIFRYNEFVDAINGGKSAGNEEAVVA